MDRFYQPSVYVLFDPRSLAPRYVGAAQMPLRDRWRSHLAAARRGVPSPVTKWIRGLMADGMLPGVALLERAVEPHAIRGEAERKWILRYRNAGADLLNVQMPGGIDRNERRIASIRRGEERRRLGLDRSSSKVRRTFGFDAKAS